METLKVTNKLSKATHQVEPQSIVISAKPGVELTKWLARQASTDGARRVITTINVDGGWVTATDGRRLAQVEVGHFTTVSGLVTDLQTGNYVITELGRVVVLYRDTGGGVRYPDWRRVMPQTDRETDLGYCFATALAVIYRACSRDDYTLNPLYLRDAYCLQVTDKGVGESFNHKAPEARFMASLHYKHDSVGGPILLQGPNKRAIVMPMRTAYHTH